MTDRPIPFRWHDGSRRRLGQFPDRRLGRIVKLMRTLLLVSLLAGAVGCTLPAAAEPRCLDLDADLCDAVWRLAQPHLLPEDGMIDDAVVGMAGGAAECHPLPCPEVVAATVYYRSGVEHSVSFQVTDGLRVTGAERVDRSKPTLEEEDPRVPGQPEPIH
jgi:hypothetical protein